VRNTRRRGVPFARAGCDVGNVGVANTVLENNVSLIFRGGPTTSTGATAVGATSINVLNRGGFAIGQTITIDLDANAETAVIATITAGSGNLGTLNLTAPLTKAHASGSSVYGPNATDPTGDMTKVFGQGSPEWNEGADSQKAPAGTARRAKAQADFVGIAIHCGNTRRASVSATPTRRPTRSRTRRAATPASRVCSERSTSIRQSTRARRA
jgi:hypothetical protein